MSTPAPAPTPEQIARRARELLRSGLFDEEFYSAVRGRAFADTRDAAEDCVADGMPQRLSPHPFLDFTLMPPEVRRAWRRGRVTALLRHLESPEGQGSPTGPLHRTGDKASASYTADRAHLVQLAGAIGAAAPFPDGIAGDWERLDDGLAQRVPGRVSVVIPTYGDAWMTVRAARSVLDLADGHDLEVVVVDNGSPAHISLRLAAELRATSGARLIRLPENLNFAGGTNVGIAASTGELLLFLNNDTVARRGWLPPLLDALRDDTVAGVQSLLLYEDDTIQSAGTVFVSDHLLPCHLLVGHPPEDGARVHGERFAAATAAALMMRAQDVVSLRGFDEGYANGFEDVDLCLRALPGRPSGFRVAPDSRITHLESKTPGRYARVMDNRALFVERWQGRRPLADPSVHQRLGFTASITSDGQALPVARVHVTGFSVTSRPRRWSINLPSTAGAWGDAWGDTHFGEALARALRGLGQDVVTRRNSAHDAGPLHLDDVHLALRGRERIPPTPGKTNILWVISHPESVVPDELAEFDLVFAASHSWSERMTRLSGRPVQPLLQATEVDPTAIAEPLPDSINEALFVGNSEGRARPIVDLAVAAGIPLAVHGRGWEGRLPPGTWRSEYVEPRDLPALYRRHGVVLADHWPDMRREGFVANRIFDVVASGAAVISDRVTGIEGIVRNRVFVCDDATAVGNAFTAIARHHAHLRGAQPEIALHTFTARARVLLGELPGR